MNFDFLSGFLLSILLLFSGMPSQATADEIVNTEKNKNTPVEFKGLDIFPPEIMFADTKSRIQDLTVENRLRLWLTAVSDPERIQYFQQAYVANAANLSADEFNFALANNDGLELVWKGGEDEYFPIEVRQSPKCLPEIVTDGSGTLEVQRHLSVECTREITRVLTSSGTENLYLLTYSPIESSATRRVIVEVQSTQERAIRPQARSFE